MRHLRITASLVLAALAVISAMAAAASALPDIAISLGGAYPAHAQASNATTAVTLGSVAGSFIEGAGVTILVLTKELTSLGEFTAIFTNYHVPGKPTEGCNTTGDAAGVVLVSGIFHVVLTSKPEQLAVLYSIKELELLCAKIEVLVKGSVMSTLKVGPEAEEITKPSGKLTGTKGKQELTEYINDSGTISKSQLLANGGAGFVQASQNIAEEVKLEVLEGKMIVITGR